MLCSVRLNTREMKDCLIVLLLFALNFHGYQNLCRLHFFPQLKLAKKKQFIAIWLIGWH